VGSPIVLLKVIFFRNICLWS